ncbi:MAG: 50S ribosome-binding GTPase [Anaerolineaceae bacterium]|nr:50S ribosome-binding GTPase [Anaerolineaceae bacterium]
MPTIDDIKRQLPPETRVIFDNLWEKLPTAEKKTFIDLLQAFPSKANMLQLLFKLGSDHMKMAFGNKHKIAIVGPANVGKSTLYNQLIHQKEDKAVVGPLPGTTRATQIADAGIFAVVDTPGADAIGEVGERERQIALDAAAQADFLIIVFDAIQGIKQTELDLYLRLTNLGKPYVVVLNKQDLVKREIKVLVDHSAKALNLAADHILPVSARNGENIPNLMKMIAATEPEIIAALGQALPQYRWQLAWRSIVSAASVSAAIALTPLPIIDFLPLVVTQSVMVLGIARIYNYKITLQRARELVVSFGIGFLGRSLFYELSKFTGLPGWMLSAAIAVSMTVVMGYAAVVWFDRGQRLSNENVQQLSREFTKVFADNIKGILKRKPGKQGMKEAIEKMLINSKLGQDRSVIEQQSEEILLLPTNVDETNS